jgi:acyl-CoA thioester hydrolase
MGTIGAQFAVKPPQKKEAMSDPIRCKHAENLHSACTRRARRAIHQPMLRYLTPLATEDLRRLGVPEPWGFGMADRVRFGELDALGHVNHTAYLRWFESFRLPYLRARGVTDYGPDAPRLVLRSIAARYHSEMFRNTDYVIAGHTTRYRQTSFTMDCAIYALPDARLVCSASAVIVLLNPDGPGRAAIPADGLAAFRDLDGAVPDG